MHPIDLTVLIGRFQPFHNGHKKIVLDALEHSEKVLILVGSANLGRSTRNPFSFGERNIMIQMALGRGLEDRVVILPLGDDPYALHWWINSVKSVVDRVATKVDAKTIALTGCDRDATTFYLNLFPDWKFLPTPHDPEAPSGTIIRQFYLLSPGSLHWRSSVPAETVPLLDSFAKTETFTTLQQRLRDEMAYREEWGAGPFQTADAVVVKRGHVLCVERQDGQIAVPGGHLEQGERLFDCAVRECREETGIFHSYLRPEERLKSFFIKSERFDDPNRSQRARIITEACLFRLPDEGDFPTVEGADDAKHAFWQPIFKLTPHGMFEDHYFVVQKLLNAL